MNDMDIVLVLDSIRYKDWVCKLTGSRCLYWFWVAPCVLTGKPKAQWSRDWHIPSDVNEEGLIRTAFAAAKMAEEHECAEHFLYNGVRVFDPHKAVLV